MASNVGGSHTPLQFGFWHAPAAGTAIRLTLTARNGVVVGHEPVAVDLAAVAVHGVGDVRKSGHHRPFALDHRPVNGVGWDPRHVDHHATKNRIVGYRKEGRSLERDES